MEDTTGVSWCAGVWEGQRKEQVCGGERVVSDAAAVVQLSRVIAKP